MEEAEGKEEPLEVEKKAPPPYEAGEEAALGQVIGFYISSYRSSET